MGVSIISMLIGLLISVMCILASLTLYRSLVRLATDTKVDSSYDGQLAAAMLTAQLEVQNAGYGLDAFKPGDLVTVNEPGHAEVRWRYKSGDEAVCRSLQEATAGDSGSLQHQVLKLREATADCTESGDLLAITAWADLSVLGRWPIVEKVKTYWANNAAGKSTLLDFSFNRLDCSPFGALQPASRLTLTITAPSSALLNGASVVSNKFTFCLPNT